MKRILTLALALTIQLPIFGQTFGMLTDREWFATGWQTNHQALAASGLTNWVALRVPDGPVVIDSANISTLTPPIHFRFYRTIGMATVTATNLVDQRQLLVSNNSHSWSNKLAILYRASTDTYLRFAITNGSLVVSNSGITSQTNVPAVGLNPSHWVLSGVVFTNLPPAAGDRLYVLQEQTRGYLLNTNMIDRICDTTGGGTIGANVPLNILAGNSTGEQVIMVEMGSAATGSVTALATNRINYMRGTIR
jgi:hypothetical protein